MKKLKLNLSNDVTWKEISPGGVINEPGNSKNFITGDWRTERPLWNIDYCKQCLLCYPTCPDTSIPVDKDGKRMDFDYDHCKGCGVCAKVCPFNAINMIDN